MSSISELSARVLTFSTFDGTTSPAQLLQNQETTAGNVINSFIAQRPTPSSSSGIEKFFAERLYGMDVDHLPHEVRAIFTGNTEDLLPHLRSALIDGAMDLFANTNWEKFRSRCLNIGDSVPQMCQKIKNISTALSNNAELGESRSAFYMYLITYVIDNMSSFGFSTGEGLLNYLAEDILKSRFTPHVQRHLIHSLIALPSWEVTLTAPKGLLELIETFIKNKQVEFAVEAIDRLVNSYEAQRERAGYPALAQVRAIAAASYFKMGAREKAEHQLNILKSIFENSRVPTRTAEEAKRLTREIFNESSYRHDHLLERLSTDPFWRSFDIR